MDVRRFLAFAGRVTVAHVVTYVVVGAAAYQLLTKAFYVGPDALFAVFMRTEADPVLWQHVMRWLVPAQVLRGVLVAGVLYPFFDTLTGWSFRKRWLVIAGLYLVLGFWAAAVAAPGTVEGLVYLRPEFDGAVHLGVQPEILVQGLAMAAWVARWMVKQPRNRVAA